MASMRVRTLARRLLGRSLADGLLLLRPRQWPILTAQLAVGVVCAPVIRDAAAGSGGEVSWAVPAAAWFAWVVGLNGGTLAFNSAYDRDEESVAYLDDPPEPPPRTAAAALALMVVGATVGLLVGTLFASVIVVCVVLSILYSHPKTRLKGVPGVDLLVNMVGYGAGTTVAGLSAGAAAGGGAQAPDAGGLWLAAGFALLFGSFYPMTQLYQLRADLDRGDRTLASALGVRGSLALALVLGALSVKALLRACGAWELPALPVAIAGGAWVLLCAVWMWRGPRMTSAGHEAWMYLGLAVWALVDAAVVAAALAGPLGWF